MNQVDQSDRREQDDVFDLRKFLNDVWAVRKPVLLSVLIVTVGYWGFRVYQLFIGSSLITHSYVIHFTFQGVDEGRYPNGMRFDISDLIAPNLLGQIYEAVGLSDEEISQSDFIRNFSVLPYSPTYAIIKKKYDILLEKADLKPSEIQKLHQEMELEISQIQNRSAKLFFKSKWGKTKKEKLKNIMLSVPHHWADNMINKYGVLELDISVISKSLFEQSTYKNLDYIIALDLLQTNIQIFLESISELQKVPSSKRVVEPETGYYLADLEKLLLDVKNYDLRLLTATVQASGTTHKVAEVSLYYEYEIDRLNREKNYETVQISFLEKTLQHYTNQTTHILSNNNAVDNPADMIQASGDFLDKISNLIKQSEDLKYKQKIYDQILEHNENLAFIDLEIAHKQALLTALQNVPNEKIRQTQLEYIDAQFPLLLSKIRDYLDVFHRFHSLLNKENFGYDTALYRIDSDKITSESIIDSSDLVGYATGVVAISLATLVIALIARYMKERD